MSARTTARGVTLTGLVALLALGPACEETEPPTESCVSLGDTCAGVETTSLGQPWFTDGATCARVLYVLAGATGGTGTAEAPFGDLPEAAAAAGAGDCIALAPGTYAGAAVGGSVSVLGAGTDHTTVQGTAGAPALALADGGDALVRGVRLTGPSVGLSLQNVGGVTVESTAVTQVAGTAIATIDASAITLRHVRVADVAAGAVDDAIGVFATRTQGLTVVHSLVERVAGPGVVAYDGDADVTESVIRDTASYGVSGGCTDALCPAPPLVVVQDSLIDRATGVGLWMSRVRARLVGNTVSRTAWLLDFSRGIEAYRTDSLEVSGNTIDQGSDLGFLITRSSATVTGNLITANLGRGAWVQNLQSPESIVLDLVDNEIDGNRHAGLGVNGVCSLHLAGGAIRNTILTAVMVNEMSGIQMGDGIEALPGSDLQVVGVTFERNGRAAILADQVTSFELTDSLFDRETQPYTVVVYNTSDTAISAAGNLAFDDSPVLPNELMPPDPLEYNAEELAAAESSL